MAKAANIRQVPITYTHNRKVRDNKGRKRCASARLHQGPPRWPAVETANRLQDVRPYSPIRRKKAPAAAVLLPALDPSLLVRELPVDRLHQWPLRGPAVEAANRFLGPRPYSPIRRNTAPAAAVLATVTRGRAGAPPRVDIMVTGYTTDTEQVFPADVTKFALHEWSENGSAAYIQSAWPQAGRCVDS